MMGLKPRGRQGARRAPSRFEARSPAPHPNREQAQVGSSSAVRYQTRQARRREKPGLALGSHSSAFEGRR